MRNRIIRTAEDRQMFNRVGGNSSDTIDACRDILPDSACQEAPMTKTVYLQMEAYRQRCIKYGLDVMEHLSLIPEVERQPFLALPSIELDVIVYLPREEQKLIMALSAEEREKVLMAVRPFVLQEMRKNVATRRL